MPELPEMETYRKLLTEQLQGATITRVQIEREKSVNVAKDSFIRTVEGSRILSVTRRAKHLLFQLDNGFVLLLHLMLGGWMYLGNETDKPERTFQVILSFGDRSLYFIGLRLGYLHLLSPAEVEERLKPLGPEPLSPMLSESSFQARLKGKKGRLKTTLVDQKWIAGIGNCYSDEISYQAGLLPHRSMNELQGEEIRRLYLAIQSVLQEAIGYGGYMEHPLFLEDRLTGGYNDQCKVYDREGEPCLRCSHGIVKEELSSRKTFYCPNCQV
ncbi:bifunctional DNA-formamidopyrimidine glycosylase/DNA-(apurinic or apyrimidinic site) lyase [Ammoniphilus sp. CFH 90114]|uniref:bifunctional DNA-formamidopyrimidine glycosylase/DNA-(apurinic or apyrimidinic site) lyase n=1 Tax=Ammoniphilus sp. CFH 90114 TaxID=2493665 RepID=UPI00100E1F77|nr:bifunctional DNA-formamidopyrimidine glycosylase/DNA-(apurinic or apyrimidinic site) lyase [Ammoniphilus sp. CFH 90114]RXT07798.1 bifunctional DNA-formamidopyrimidine glycosylase/DNA-(apurinic or apyrimidinic site) lyase [Ammoniphilus sp. CFH 90114]